MEELKQVYINVLNYFDIKDESGELADLFINQVIDIFAQEVLKKNLNESEFSLKIEEYKKLSAEGNKSKIYDDLQKIIKPEDEKVLAMCFINHLKKFTDKLLEEGEISEQKLEEFDRYFSNMISSISMKMSIDNTSADSGLKSIAQ